MSGDVVKLKGRKEIHRQWKYGHISWQEYKDLAKQG